MSNITNKNIKSNNSELMRNKQSQLEEINRPKNEELFSSLENQYCELAKVKSESEQIEEMDKTVEEMATVIRAITIKCGECECYKDGHCFLPFPEICGENDDICSVCEALYNAGYRKQSEGEWITKRRHRGGFRTVYVVDRLGEKHMGTLDDRWECNDLYCSVCGKISHDAFLNYCANCGAKMKGE